jgi:hypothetical protein
LGINRCPQGKPNFDIIPPTEKTLTEENLVSVAAFVSDTIGHYAGTEVPALLSDMRSGNIPVLPSPPVINM